MQQRGILCMLERKVMEMSKKKKDKKKDKKKKKEENSEKLYTLDNYGSALKDMRMAQGLKQIDVAKAAGVGQSTVSAAEHGSEKISVLALKSIANALGCRVVITFRK